MDRAPCSWHPTVYQDLSMRHDWCVKKPLFDELPEVLGKRL